MAAKKLIPVKEFCVLHNISSELVVEFSQHDLIELVVVEKKRYIPEKQLQMLEKMIRLHRELQINLEGIETILYLLQRLEQKDAALKALQAKLDFYR